jgi:hypothetical protein
MTHSRECIGLVRFRYSIAPEAIRIAGAVRTFLVLPCIAS